MRKHKETVAEKYMPKMKAIKKSTLESIRKSTAKYILVDKEGNAYCDRCQTEFPLLGSKHKSMVKCPNCKHTLEIWHTHRRSTLNDQIDWSVVAEHLEGNQIVYRYVLAYRQGKTCTVSEHARAFFDFSNQKEYYYELPLWDYQGDTWKKSQRYFFKEFHMCYQTNRFCCLGGKEYTRTFFKEVSKLDVFKYVDVKAMWEFDMYPASVSCWLGKRIDLYEKLQKVGLNALIKADLHTYWREEIAYNNSERELTKMLGISKVSLNALKSAPTLNNLRAMQSVEITEEDIVRATQLKGDIRTFADLKKANVKHLEKTFAYITEQKVNADRYSKYVEMLKSLDLDTDKAYLFPKDFEEMYKQIKGTFEAKKMSIKDALIKNITDGLKAMPELQSFFNGNGNSKYLVSVPDSVMDFVQEGINQHNCVGSNLDREGSNFVDRMIKKEAFVFFIRECNNPSASFVTMEYRNGSVVQLMYNHNVAVQKDTEIYQFANALATTMASVQTKVA